MSQVSESMALPSKPAPEYRQDPERVKYLLYCFKTGATLALDTRKVTGYANVGALYEFSFSDQTRELLDGTAPDDFATLIRTFRPDPLREANIRADIACKQRDDARKDVSMWKDEAELMCRAAKRWAFYCSFALAGGVVCGYLLGRFA